MIDTIVLRIHHIKSYKLLYEQYYNSSRKKNTVSQSYINEETGEFVETSFSRAITFHDTNKILPIVYRSSERLPSSHYSITYNIVTAKNYLEFNFSVPKYCYGNNVMQFLFLIEPSAHSTFIFLSGFVKHFMKRHFCELPVLEDVEVNRIDLCYNQFFNNKDDALNYLNEQKRLIEKTVELNKAVGKGYNTTAWYKTRRYSFKIYHKGTEFAKNDYKEIMKAGNPRKLNCMFLQSQADCILRYEMTFRSSAMKYLFDMYFLKSDTKLNYHHYRSYRVGKLIRELAMLDNNVSKGRFQKESLLDRFNKLGKIFTLSTDFDKTSDLHKLKDTNLLPFDSMLFQILYDTFWAKVQECQFDTAVSFSDMKARITELHKQIDFHNNYTTKKAGVKPDKNRLTSYILLLQYVDFSTLKNLMPERTFYRLKKELAAVGVTPKSSKISVPKPRTDYLDYRTFFSHLHSDDSLFFYN